MKKLTLFSILLASIVSIVGARADSIKAAAICAGAATLSNGSIVNIGQPFVGVMSTTGGASISLGLIPELVSTNKLPVPLPPHISDPTSEGSSFRLTLTSSEIGRRYFLQATTNFTDWVPLNSTAGTGFTLIFEHSDLTNFEYRFYRVGVE